MLTETFYTLISGISSLSPIIRTVPLKSASNVASRRQFSQRFNPLTRRFCSIKNIQLRISALANRKYFFHHSCKCANQISTSLKTDLSLGAKLKRLSREYGWSAFGVYLMLSALDFPFCYLLVKYLGSERIGKWEQAVTSSLKSLVPEDFKRTYTEWRASIQNIRSSSDSPQESNNEKDVHSSETSSNSVEEAEKNNKKDATITPKIVKTLRGWGWDIGKRTTKEAKVLNRARLRIKAQKPVSQKRTFIQFTKFARLSKFSKDR